MRNVSFSVLSDLLSHLCLGSFPFSYTYYYVHDMQTVPYCVQVGKQPEEWLRKGRKREENLPGELACKFEETKEGRAQYERWLKGEQGGKQSWVVQRSFHQLCQKGFNTQEGS